MKVWLARYFQDLLATLSLNILPEGMIVNNKVTTTAKPNWTIPMTRGNPPLTPLLYKNM